MHLVHPPLAPLARFWTFQVCSLGESKLQCRRHLGSQGESRFPLLPQLGRP